MDCNMETTLGFATKFLPMFFKSTISSNFYHQTFILSILYYIHARVTT